MSTERDNAVSGVSRPAILRFDQPADTSSADLTATHDWNLTADLPPVAANAGLEGIAFVPDAYLVARGLQDESTGTPYDPSAYPDHGTAGSSSSGSRPTGWSTPTRSTTRQAPSPGSPSSPAASPP